MSVLFFFDFIHTNWHSCFSIHPQYAEAKGDTKALEKIAKQDDEASSSTAEDKQQGVAINKAIHDALAAVEAGVNLEDPDVKYVRK